jgi:methionine-S-sulfoxide reductase
VGYAGGKEPNPTYYAIGGHSETVEVDFDPTVISYGELLEIYWEAHNPFGPSYSSQYASVIFYHNETQRLEAEKVKARLERELGRTLYTDIRPLERFYLAEDYHQKYYLQSTPDLWREYRAIYPDMQDLLGSTAVARVNGYVALAPSAAELEAVLPQLGLSDEAAQTLLRRARR